MKEDIPLEHQFVSSMPKLLEERKVYVSIEYATAVHKCLCGCGSKVVTPICPTGWELRFDGDTVSLTPSIGDWGFKCRSHYWIRRDKAVWAGDMTDDEVEVVRANDRAAREAYFGRRAPAQAAEASGTAKARPRGLWKRLFGRR